MIEFANDSKMLTIGKLLKNERERQELSLDDISERTKINVKYLKAIEEDRKDGFPGDLYCELFTKSYAEALGLEYAKIKAGTFSATERKFEVDRRSRKKSAKRSDAVSEDTRTTSHDRPPDRSSRLEPRTGETTELSVARSGDDALDSPESERSQSWGRPEILKYLLVVAAVVFCLLIVVVYISISADGTSDQESDDAAIESGPPSGAQQSIAGEERPGEKVVPDMSVVDSGEDGPVTIFPESLQVEFVASEESWARVVSDGDTIFTSFFEPGEEHLFTAAGTLEVHLGRWEFVSGKVYGLEMKDLNLYHTPGRSIARLLITKDNWESFIDSTTLDDGSN
jgi:transcriptional regulator with XRE-family HTH domain